MFAKQDQKFDEMASNRASRRAAIAGMSVDRAFAFWPLLLIFICLGIFGSRFSSWNPGLLLCAGLAAAFKFLRAETNLRLLRTIDWLERKYGGESTAPFDPPCFPMAAPPLPRSPIPELPPLQAPVTELRPIPLPATDNP